MTYNWCHGPSCHTNATQSRVRGSKGNKVLRTIKIKEGGSYRTHEHYSMFNYFCNQSCLMDFIRTHLQSIVAIAPRREPLETPIKDPTKETHSNNYHSWSNWTIEKKVG
jgi:hypothetical protein